MSDKIRLTAEHADGSRRTCKRELLKRAMGCEEFRFRLKSL